MKDLKDIKDNSFVITLKITTLVIWQWSPQFDCIFITNRCQSNSSVAVADRVYLVTEYSVSS